MLTIVRQLSVIPVDKSSLWTDSEQGYLLRLQGRDLRACQAASFGRQKNSFHGIEKPGVTGSDEEDKRGN